MVPVKHRNHLIEGGLQGLLLLGFWGVYHQTATRFCSGDGLCRMLDIEFGAPLDLLNPFHLLYSPLGKAIVWIAHRLGNTHRALFLMQQVNAVWGAFAVGIFYRLLRNRFSKFTALMASTGLGLSLAFWTEMVDPGSYALAAFSTCLLLVLLDRADTFSPFWTGLLHGMAVLTHLMLLLVSPAFLLRIGWKKDNGTRKRILYLLGLALPVGFSYGTILWLLGPGDAIHWLLAPAWRPHSNFFTENYFTFDFLPTLSRDWMAFVNSLVSPWPECLAFGWACQLLIAVWLALIVYAGFRHLRSIRLQNDKVLALALWIVSLNVFQFFYATGNERFRILFLPALILLFLELSRVSQLCCWFGRVLCLLIPIMVIVNFSTTIYPQTRLERNTTLLRSLWVSRHLHSNDFFVFLGSRQPPSQSIWNFYLAYFAPMIPARSFRGYFFASGDTNLDGMTKLIESQRAQGRHLVLEAILWDPAQQNAIEKSFQLPGGALQRWIKQWPVIESRLRSPDGYTLYRVH